MQDAGVNHVGLYRSLRDGLERQGAVLPPINSEHSVALAWGWDHPDAGETRLLAKGQEELKKVAEHQHPPDGFSFSGLAWTLPASKVRDLLFKAWSDIAYYITAEGTRRTRQAVWRKMLTQVPTDEPVDLTLIAHSGGTLVAHDFLWWLFGPWDEGSESDRETRWSTIARTALWQGARENWRLRRFVTFGCPLTPTFVRAPALADRFATEDQPWLRAGDIGLETPSHAGPMPLWINAWDKHDVLAFPVEDVYGSQRVKDVYPDHSDWWTSHIEYWESERVHRAIARVWDM